MTGSPLAAAFVAIRPDTSGLKPGIDKALAGVDGAKAGARTGQGFAAGFSRTGIDQVTGNANKKLIGTAQVARNSISTIFASVRSEAGPALAPLLDVGAGFGQVSDAVAAHGKSISTTFLGIGAGALAAGGVLTTVGSTEQAAVAQLRNAIDNTGGSFEDYEARIDKVDKANESFGYTTAQTDQALQTLVNSTHDPSKALDLMAEAADLAASKHISLNSAATQLARLIGGRGARTLAQYNIALVKNADGTTNWAKTNEELAKVLDGQASAAADTFTGHIKAISAAVEDNVAKFGQKWGPAIMAAGGIVSGLSAIWKVGASAIESLGAKFTTSATAAADAATAMVTADGTAAASAATAATEITSAHTAIQGSLYDVGVAEAGTAEAAVAESGVIIGANTEIQTSLFATATAAEDSAAAAVAADGTVAAAGAVAAEAVVAADATIVAANAGVGASFARVLAALGPIALVAVAVGEVVGAFHELKDAAHGDDGLLKQLKADFKDVTGSAATSSDALLTWAEVADGKWTTTAPIIQGVIKDIEKLGITQKDLNTGILGSDDAYNALIASIKAHGGASKSDLRILKDMHAAFGSTIDPAVIKAIDDMTDAQIKHAKSLGIDKDSYGGLLAQMDDLKAKQSEQRDLIKAEIAENFQLMGTQDQLATKYQITASQVQDYAAKVGISQDQVANGTITQGAYTAAVDKVVYSYQHANTAQRGLLDATDAWNKSAKTSADKAALIGAALKSTNGDALGFGKSMSDMATATASFVTSITQAADTMSTTVPISKDTIALNRKYVNSILDAKTGTIDYANAAAGPFIDGLLGIQDAADKGAEAIYQHEVGTKGDAKATKDATEYYLAHTKYALIDQHGKLSTTATDLGVNATQAQQLTDKYLGVPKDISTKISQSGGDPVVTLLTTMNSWLHRIADPAWAAKVDAQDAATAKIKTIQTEISDLKQHHPTEISVVGGDAYNTLRDLNYELDQLSGKVVSIDVYGTVHQTGPVAGGHLKPAEAMGGILYAYAAGGIETHWPQIARTHGARIWNEPETMGEAYIPLANDYRRARAKAIAAQTVALLGGHADFGAGTLPAGASGTLRPRPGPATPAPAAPNVTVYQTITNPLPERASVSGPAGLRRAAYALGR